MNLKEYLDNINKRFKSGISREHTYRGYLQTLLESIATDVLVTNEPARISCGAPDYIITKNDIPVGYIEAKDIGKDLGSKEFKEQFDRYKKSLNNLIITDYLDFWLYVDGEFATSIKIAEIKNNNIIPLPENYEPFLTLIKDFCTRTNQTIKSASKLSKMMAGKAKMLAQVIEKALSSDEENQEDSTLKDQMNAFKQILIHDITPKEFSDIYAQTIAYGMFAGRLHDKNLETFSRKEAAELIPKSNPFLRKLFQYIAGYDLDSRIVWIVDSLADIFRATNVDELLKNFGKSTQQHDTIIHFYETFLSEYDPKLRKARGVWYTPEPVVKFIVRAVDDILKTEFGLKDGLSDTSKTKIMIDTQIEDKRSKSGYKQIEQEIHKVQILDPATGTGTFLSEVVKHIYKKFQGQQGIWSNYVENHLVPRLNGFELLMASYAMAHLKLDMLLSETGYKPKKENRFRIYLTNSLEEYHPSTGTLFASWLSNEANEANYIKRDTPVMVIIGNPPYSGESSNKGEWILKLMEDYKKEPEGIEKLKEKNSKWLNDDYVKFLRYGQHFIEKNGEGVLAFINPHGFLDNPTFRGMRWNLLKTYDKIYTIDLHGNAKKKEVCPDGSKDENVFDIEQGVSINFFIKTGKKKVNDLGKVFHYDLYGKRDFKYSFLNDNNLKSIYYKELLNLAPEYFFVPKNNDLKGDYDKGFFVSDLFTVNSVGIVTSRDDLVIDSNKDLLKKKIKLFFEKDVNYIKNEMNVKENSLWKIENIKNKAIYNDNYIKKISYRPFDNQYIYFDTKNFLERSRDKIMNNFLDAYNIGLVISKQSVGDWRYIFISKNIIDFNLTGTAGRLGSGNLCPLYIYTEKNAQQNMLESLERTPNLDLEIVKIISEKLNLTFTNEKEETENTFAPIDILDYIYAILHSPNYREKYKDFLKIDFPKVPYPKDKDVFLQLVKLGGEIRLLHLLESRKIDEYITSYPNDGSNKITRAINKNDWELYDIENNLGRVWINDEQFFDKIPLVAWDFYIGGYQPAQKWLKDRKERELDFDDISHYQKIIVALFETARLMKEIDKLWI